MGLKLFVLLVALLATHQCTYIQVQHFFDNSEAPNQWDLSGWFAPGGIQNQVALCALNSIIGGYSYFGQGSYLEHQAIQIPILHAQIQISFNVFQIDDWEPGEKFQVWVDDVLIFEKEQTQNAPQDICGNQQGPEFWNEQMETIVLPPIAHSDPSVKIRFTSTLDEGPSNESWGINELKIFAYVDCGSTGAWFNQNCVPQTFLQQCYNQLGLLDPTGTNNADVQNSCEWDTVDDEIVYFFEIEYYGDYEHDPACVQQTIEIEGKVLQQGDWTTTFDVWTYDENTGKIYFKIKHQDLLGLWCCEFEPLPTKFRWICDITLRIWFDGYEQFEYNFTMKSELLRDVEDSTVVDVTKNVVVGDCCNNYLDIETELLLCTDLSCTSFHPTNLMNPYEYERLSEVIVLHRIVTPEFQHYYVNILQFLIGPFEPTTYDYYGSNPGGTIIVFHPSVAMEGIVLKSIAIIQESPSFSIGPGRRRALSSLSNEQGDLTVQGTRQISIRDPEDMPGFGQNSEQTQELIVLEQERIEAEEDKKKTFQMLMVVVGIVGTLLISSVIGAVFYMKRVNQKRMNFQLKQNKLEQDSARSGFEN